MLNKIKLAVGIIGMYVLLIGCTTTNGTPQQITCGEDQTPPTKPEVLDRLPILTEPLEFEDPPGDFNLVHPFYEENFDAVGAFENARIPSTLDIRMIRLVPEGEEVIFHFLMLPPEDDDPSLGDLLTDGRRIAQMGVFIDTDQNGSGDLILSTTSEPELGLITTQDVNEQVGEFRIEYGEAELVMFVPVEIIGDRFDWFAFSGFTPIEGNVFLTELDILYFLPMVDMYHPQNLPGNVGFTTSYTGTGKQCYVTKNNYNSCPAMGNPTLGPVLNTSYQGVLLYDVRCDGRGYSFWCLSQSFFGKYVYDGSKTGWIAKCPYKYGCNGESRVDLDSDGLVDKIIHYVYDSDGGCSINSSGSHYDSDNDNLLDYMVHTYLYSTHLVTSCNQNRDYSTKALVSEKCKAAQTPYTDPGAVPGAIP